MKTDLHIHTNYSDGHYSPYEMVRKADEANLKIIAITDHDCVEGVKEALKAGKKFGVTVIPAIEFSCNIDNVSSEIHVIGYIKDYKNKTLSGFLRQFASTRAERVKEIIKRLGKAGVTIDYEQVLSYSGKGVVGRPHIAHVMVDEGYSPSVTSAFYQYLAEGSPAYVPKTPLKIETAIELTHKSGGLAIWAHPKIQHIKKYLLYFKGLGRYRSISSRFYSKRIKKAI
jgi:predicted metal-dependent phosphoesterase TrpH